MPTDLERQLPRFAQALEREASAISVDEILGSGTVAIDVDEVTLVDDSIELELNAAEPPRHRRVALKIALAVAAAVVLVVALAAIVRIENEPDPVDVPPPTVPAPPSTTREGPTSGGMWPQSTLEEMRAAQERADAGDPAYTWQIVDPQLADDDSWTYEEPGQIELVDRFLREVLGWEAYILNPMEGMDRNGVSDNFYDQRYLRCAPGQTNPLYPAGPEPVWGELCAPTIDDLHYESVSLDLIGLDPQRAYTIWVVSRWGLTAPFVQADPAVVETRATERLEELLAARVAGHGAEGLVKLGQGIVEVPLLYATTSGAPYERYEIERAEGPVW